MITEPITLTVGWMSHTPPGREPGRHRRADHHPHHRLVARVDVGVDTSREGRSQETQRPAPFGSATRKCLQPPSAGSRPLILLWVLRRAVMPGDQGLRIGYWD